MSIAPAYLVQLGFLPVDVHHFVFLSDTVRWLTLKMDWEPKVAIVLEGNVYRL